MLAGTLESPCSAEELAGSIDSLYPIPKSQKAVPHVDPLGQCQITYFFSLSFGLKCLLT